MMSPCCVEGCEITSEETFYFEFPTSRILRRKWLDLIPIPGKLPLGTVVCSRHFSSDDYESVRGKVRLKGKVVPSLYLKKQTPTSEIPLPNGPPLTKALLSPKSPLPTEAPLSPKSPPPTNTPKSPLTTKAPLLLKSPPLSTEAPLSPKSTLISTDAPLSPKSTLIPTDAPLSPKSTLIPTDAPLSPKSTLIPTDAPLSPKSTLIPTEAPLSPKSPPPTKTPLSPKSPPSSPSSPTKVIEAGGDSTTVSVPSPIDAERMIDEIQNRIIGSIQKLTATTPNGVNWGIGRSRPATPVAPLLDPKEDIEDMITNYHIKNKVPNPALLADLVPPSVLVPGLVPEGGQMVPVEFEVPFHEVVNLEDVKEADPVFIEVPVDKDASTEGAGSQDCLMVLESVQVEVDPSPLLLTHDPEYYREQEWKESRKNDPISLLTSSDEDDVILQEPHIDTVEVSDETDEDDQPLVKLAKKRTSTSKKKIQKKKSKLKKSRPQNIEKIVWGMYDFFCVQCHFSTKNAEEYNKHISEHSTVLHVCPICSYTSASSSMFAKHSRIHKTEKKFKCHLCDYRARHKMSLIFHLKKHNCDITAVKDFKCKRCGFKSDSKLLILEHLSACKQCDKKHVCEKCDYKTNKKSDLKRHRMRIHPDDCNSSP